MTPAEVAEELLRHDDTEPALQELINFLDKKEKEVDSQLQITVAKVVNKLATEKQVVPNLGWQCGSTVFVVTKFETTLLLGFHLQFLRPTSHLNKIANLWVRTHA